MNRVIKFRGQRADNKEWIVGQLAYFFNDLESPFIMPKNYYATRDFNETDDNNNIIIQEEVALGGFINVIPETVGQFTGLLDKNGKEMYEGDIIQDTVVGMKSQVVFTDYANFGIKSLAGIKDLEYDVIDPSWTSTSVEIIGNIHENPELLQ